MRQRLGKQALALRPGGPCSFPLCPSFVSLLVSPTPLAISPHLSLSCPTQWVGSGIGPLGLGWPRGSSKCQRHSQPRWGLKEGPLTAICLFPPLAVCQILPKGVVSVLGPSSSPASASTVSHICGEKEVSRAWGRAGVGPWEARLGAWQQGGSQGSFSVQIPHIKVGPEETPRLQYLRFASVSLYPSNEDVSLAVSRILKSFNYPSASLICAKAECEGELDVLFLFPQIPPCPRDLVSHTTQAPLVPHNPSPSGTQTRPTSLKRSFGQQVVTGTYVQGPC